MPLLRTLSALSLAAWACAFCQWVALPNLFISAAAAQLPFGGAAVTAWQNGVPSASEAVPGDDGPIGAGGSRVPHTGYLGPDARPPAGLPLWPPLTHWGEVHDQPLLGCRFRDPQYATHTGADFPLDAGQTVHATLAGQVVWAGENGPWGQLVVVENGGYQTWFAHLSQLTVAVSQTVAMGDPLGLSGNTGNSSGPHLHYGVKQFAGPDDARGAWLNPESFFDLGAVSLIGCGG